MEENNKRISVEETAKISSLTREEKVNYFCIALGLQRIGVDHEMADRLIETYEAILHLGGKFSINDAVNVELALDRRWRKKDVVIKEE